MLFLLFFFTNSPLELNNSIAAAFFLPVIKVEILNNYNNMMFNSNYFPYTTQKISIPVNQKELFFCVNTEATEEAVHKSWEQERERRFMKS